MKRINTVVCSVLVAFFVLSFVFLAPPVAAQKTKPPVQPAGPLLTRTTPRHETHRLAYGGTVSIVGAPTGSVTVEGWQRSEIEITAEIELQAGTAADLDRLAAVNGFSVDVDTNHIRILTTGAHDKKFLKSVDKNFPKALIGLPWKIDYHIKIPAITDLEIDAGNGPIKLSGVEGAVRINAVACIADLSLTGGAVSAIIQTGTINVSIPSRSWHGLGARVQVASGNIDVALMPGFSGDINADVLRIGEVKNSYPNLEPRSPNSMSARSISARAGSGGGVLGFTVGDGVIQIRQAGEK